MRPSRLAVVTLAALTATATAGIVPRLAGADRDGFSDLRNENASLRNQLSYYQSAYRELSDGLDRIDRVADRSSDRRARFAIARTIADARERAGRFVGDRVTPGGPGDRRDDRPGDRPDRNHGWPDAPRTPPVIADADFARIAAHVKDSFASEQLEQVKSLARTSYVTVDQVITLMQVTAFDSSRIEIAATLYPRVVDRQRWALVDEALDFSSSRAALRGRLGL